MHYDVFNGDADGLCALHQLRLAQPKESIRITGVKRDIGLLQRVHASPGDSVTILDISLVENAAALERLLAQGVRVEYFDHHAPGRIPSHPLLRLHIDTAPDVCTGIIVDRVLSGRFRAWAIAAAFGDNLHLPARQLATTLALTERELAAIQRVGEALAYNAYADCESDLIVHPAVLYERLSGYADPVAFGTTEAVVATIMSTREGDLALARTKSRVVDAGAHRVLMLPDEPWSRRVRAAYGNELALSAPDRAHAILVPDRSGDFTVSVRAPIAHPYGADRLCAHFPRGGGRAAAAGVNGLSAGEVDAFVRAFANAFTG